MTELAVIAKEHGGIIETKTAAQHGISKAMLYRLCKQNKIYRIVKGQYIFSDDMRDELLSISMRSTQIIFSHETALYLHGISDRTPFEHTVTAPSGCIPSAAIKSECKDARGKGIASIFGGAFVSKAMSLKEKIHMSRS